MRWRTLTVFLTLAAVVTFVLYEVARARALDCNTARELSRTYSRSEIRSMAVAAGLPVTAETTRAFDSCFARKPFRKKKVRVRR